MMAKQRPSERGERLKHIEQENIIQLEEVRELKRQHAEIQKVIDALERANRARAPSRHQGSAVPKVEREIEDRCGYQPDVGHVTARHKDRVDQRVRELL